MSRALEPIEDCEILKRNPRLEWSDGQYRYLIEKKGNGYVYRVTDGAQAAEAMLQYAFGVGQSQNVRVSGGWALSRKPRELLPETKGAVPDYRRLDRQTGKRTTGLGSGPGSGRDSGLLRLPQYGRTARRQSSIGKV